MIIDFEIVWLYLIFIGTTSARPKADFDDDSSVEQKAESKPAVLADYQFAYEVKDDRTTNYHNRVELLKDGYLQGSYSHLAPDGIVRTIVYSDDGTSGYQATMHELPTDIKVVGSGLPGDPLIEVEGEGKSLLDAEAFDKSLREARIPQFGITSDLSDTTNLFNIFKSLDKADDSKDSPSGSDDVNEIRALISNDVDLNPSNLNKIPPKSSKVSLNPEDNIPVIVLEKALFDNLKPTDTSELISGIQQALHAALNSGGDSSKSNIIESSNISDNTNALSSDKSLEVNKNNLQSQFSNSEDIVNDLNINNNAQGGIPVIGIEQKVFTSLDNAQKHHLVSEIQRALQTVLKTTSSITPSSKENGSRILNKENNIGKSLRGSNIGKSLRRNNIGKSLRGNNIGKSLRGNNIGSSLRSSKTINKGRASKRILGNSQLKNDFSNKKHLNVNKEKINVNQDIFESLSNLRKGKLGKEHNQINKQIKLSKDNSDNSNINFNLAFADLFSNSGENAVTVELFNSDESFDNQPIITESIDTSKDFSNEELIFSIDQVTSAIGSSDSSAEDQISQGDIHFDNNNNRNGGVPIIALEETLFQSLTGTEKKNLVEGIQHNLQAALGKVVIGADSLQNNEKINKNNDESIDSHEIKTDENILPLPIRETGIPVIALDKSVFESLDEIEKESLVKDIQEALNKALGRTNTDKKEKDSHSTFKTNKKIDKSNLKSRKHKINSKKINNSAINSNSDGSHRDENSEELISSLQPVENRRNKVDNNRDLPRRNDKPNKGGIPVIALEKNTFHSLDESGSSISKEQFVKAVQRAMQVALNSELESLINREKVSNKFTFSSEDSGRSNIRTTRQNNPNDEFGFISEFDDAKDIRIKTFTNNMKDFKNMHNKHVGEQLF